MLREGAVGKSLHLHTLLISHIKKAVLAFLFPGSISTGTPAKGKVLVKYCLFSYIKAYIGIHYGLI